jgi:hypothetical protein
MVGYIYPEELVPERVVLTFLFMSKNVKNCQKSSNAFRNHVNPRKSVSKKYKNRVNSCLFVVLFEKTNPICYRRERRDRKDKALPFMGRLDTQSP